ncbi:hypothetical protein [Ruminiclostridium cellobioparum]|uniref:Uncharacterized protein n=1 Tax=Ruminiclostridium cellobioparum subsp. termitidis CT1112 TaxID=1195236 RepID=S0FKY4_RUMCE|nr:hypothetical protein [Ruminiclostridium cellobioparum]EMS72845.1 hypothetical protein CTER_1178 [Ruminiclostridium cellobioparum subsp. termitidis CT1112]
MLRKLKLTFMHYIVVFTVVFIIGTIISFYTTRNTAVKILESHPEFNVFYWLSPEFCVIQTGNFILLCGGIFACIFGTILPSEKNNFLLQIFSTMKKLLIGNFIFWVTSILTSFILEELTISYVRNINISKDILFHSLKMFIAVYIFLSFWGMIGYGLKLTFSNIPIALILGTSIQLLEIYVIFFYLKSTFLKFLPTALSRQIVVYQFPFWELDSWANVKSVIPFASAPLIMDKSLQLVKINYIWIFCFLIWYLLLVYFKPMYKYVLYNLQKKENSVIISDRKSF